MTPTTRHSPAGPAPARPTHDPAAPAAEGAAVLIVRLDHGGDEVIDALRRCGLAAGEVPAEVAAAADGADTVVIVADPPGRAAVELAERLLEAAAVTATVLVLFTEDPGNEAVAAALAAGADSCLAAPVAPEVLVATVRALARRGAAARDMADWRGISKNAMDRAPVVGLLAMDEQAQVVAANDRLRSMPVWAPPGIGLPVERALPGRLGSRLRAMVRRVTDTGEPQHEEVVIGRPPDESHWQVRAFAVASPSGRIRGVEAVLDDVTELQRTLARLRASEQRWRAVWESPQTGIALRDRHARLIECNETYARMFGVGSVEELVGTDYGRLLAPEDAEDAHRLFARRWAETTETDAHEHAVRLRDGRELIVHGTMTNIYDAAGNLVARLTLSLDITERRRLETELARAQRLDALGRLAGGCAHDVNNMMAVILGYAELAASGLGPDHPQQRELAEIRRAAEHSASLAHDLLAFGRQQVLERRPLVAAQCVEGLSNLLRHTMGQEVELVTEDASAGAMVLGDKAQLETVVVNLVTNARDATPAGGRVTLRTGLGPPDGRAPDGVVVISVTDTGRGMDEHVRERIFEPFFTTKERSRGTGLGLATVAGIVDQMGGWVSVESHAGRGSRFEVSLPRLPATDDSGSADEGDDGDAADPGRTVLVVEDQAALRRLVERMLTDVGHRVLGAATATEALQLLHREGETIDVLLTDMILPDLPGGELAAQALQARPGLRVIYTSGYAGEQAARDGVPDGHGFLAKPYGMDDLRRALRAAFARD